MPDYQYVLYEIEGEVAKITMNRPDQRNAINRELAEELLDAFTRVEGREKGQGGACSAGPANPSAPAETSPVLPSFDHYTVLDWLGRTGSASSGPSPKTRRWWWPR